MGPVAGAQLLGGAWNAQAVNQGLQPASDIAAAGNGGEIVEARQQPRLGERLQDAQRERGAADAAAGEAQGGQGGIRWGIGAEDGDAFRCEHLVGGLLRGAFHRLPPGAAADRTCSRFCRYFA